MLTEERLNELAARTESAFEAWPEMRAALARIANTLDDGFIEPMQDELRRECLFEDILLVEKAQASVSRVIVELGLVAGLVGPDAAKDAVKFMGDLEAQWAENRQAMCAVLEKSKLH